jgi:hypothetical protein
MTNHVTPQTATRLKKSGFPQPEQKPGQFWYLQNQLYIIVAILTYKAGKTAILYEICGEHRDPDPLPVSLPFSDAFVYAPGALEILQVLGAGYSVTKLMDKEIWYCDFLECTAQTTPFHKVTLLSFHESAVEACAMVWEAKQSKQ